MQAHTRPTPQPRAPQIAVAAPDTLACLGLAGIIERVMPVAEVRMFPGFATLREADAGQFVHYFISMRVLLESAPFFLERRHKTIVLVHGDESCRLPQGFHTLNVCLDEERLVRAFLRLVEMAHGTHGTHPGVAGRKPAHPAAAPLTPREQEVLRLIVAGRINKEIATSLGVSLTTVITHRKNLSEKLGIKSVSGLTIYAVMHGLVKAEEI